MKMSPSQKGMSTTISSSKTSETDQQQMAALAVQEDFDSKSSLKISKREAVIPLFFTEEIMIEEETLHKNSFWVVFSLKGMTLRGDYQRYPPFDRAMEQNRGRFADRSHDGNYSVKFLNPQALEEDKETSANVASALMTEARILMNMAAHPHICQLYGMNASGIEVFSSKGMEESFFLIIDSISETLPQRFNAWREKKGYEGERFDDLESRQSQLTQRLEVALDICSAMVFLSNRELVFHLHPERVGFDSRYKRVKLFNFGPAREHGMKQPEDNMILRAYLAPETLKDDEVTVSADVYSFGILIWEFLILKHPFEGVSKDSHLQNVAIGRKRPPMNKTWPEDLQKLMESCWDASVDKRPTMKAVFETLENCLMFQNFASIDQTEAHETHDMRETNSDNVKKSRKIRYERKPEEKLTSGERDRDAKSTRSYKSNGSKSIRSRESASSKRSGETDPSRKSTRRKSHDQPDKTAQEQHRVSAEGFQEHDDEKLEIKKSEDLSSPTKLSSVKDKDGKIRRSMIKKPSSDGLAKDRTDVSAGGSSRRSRGSQDISTGSSRRSRGSHDRSKSRPRIHRSASKEDVTTESRPIIRGSASNEDIPTDGNRKPSRRVSLRLSNKSKEEDIASTENCDGSTVRRALSRRKSGNVESLVQSPSNRREASRGIGRSNSTSNQSGEAKGGRAAPERHRIAPSKSTSFDDMEKIKRQPMTRGACRHKSGTLDEMATIVGQEASDRRRGVTRHKSGSVELLTSASRGVIEAQSRRRVGRTKSADQVGSDFVRTDTLKSICDRPALGRKRSGDLSSHVENAGSRDIGKRAQSSRCLGVGFEKEASKPAGGSAGSGDLSRHVENAPSRDIGKRAQSSRCLGVGFEKEASKPAGGSAGSGDLSRHVENAPSRDIGKRAQSSRGLGVGFEKDDRSGNKKLLLSMSDHSKWVDFAAGEGSDGEGSDGEDNAAFLKRAGARRAALAGANGDFLRPSDRDSGPTNNRRLVVQEKRLASQEEEARLQQQRRINYNKAVITSSKEGQAQTQRKMNPTRKTKRAQLCKAQSIDLFNEKIVEK
jgi:hypothetical protein